MINDLVNNHFNSRMDRKEIIELLGEPEEKVKIESDNDFKYLIFEDYGWDIDPVETAHLIIVFDKDSTIKKILMKKWKHHQDENFKELNIK